jgi:hypothetical protein
MNEQIGYAIFLAVVVTIIVIIVLAVKHHKKKEFQTSDDYNRGPAVNRIPVGSTCPPGWTDAGIIKSDPSQRMCYMYA